MQTSPVEHLTPKKLAARYGATERWWQRYLPELHRLGRISKRGRLFFGQMSEVADWLAAGSAEPDR